LKLGLQIEQIDMATLPTSRRKESPSEPLKRALAVTCRAIAGDAEVGVDFAAVKPTIDGKHIQLPEPSRVPNAREVAIIRGWADSLSLTAACHDAKLHNKLAPSSGQARLIFEAVERARVEAVGSNRMIGMAQNLTAMPRSTKPWPSIFGNA
jgi:cobaltochelatase CobT